MVTVIIHTYERPARLADLERTLGSLNAQVFRDFCVLVVENGPINPSLEAAVRKKLNQDLPLTLIYDSTKKLSYLFNLGWKSTKTELLAFLADDAEADTNWLSAIVSELTADKKTAVVTGPLVSTSHPAGEMHRLYLLTQSNLLLKILAWPYLHFALEDGQFLPGKLFESGAYSFGASLDSCRQMPRQKIDLATTTSMGIKRKALEAAGGFDESFWFNHADGDLYIRLKQMGYLIIFDPKVVAYHHVRYGPSRDSYNIGRDTALFYKKHVRPKTIGGLVGFTLNLVVFICYWLYMLCKTKNVRQLNGILGFIGWSPLK